MKNSDAKLQGLITDYMTITGIWQPAAGNPPYAGLSAL